MGEAGTDDAECHMTVVSIGKRLAGSIKCVRLWDESCLMPVLMYGSEAMIGKKAVQMGNLRGLLGFRRADKVLDAQIWLCSVIKRINERIDGVLG